MSGTTSPVEEYDVMVESFYTHFVVADKLSSKDISTSFGPRTSSMRCAINGDVVGVVTVFDHKVPVVVNRYATEPILDYDLWDHVVKISLEITNGGLIVAGSMEYFPDAFTLPLANGIYNMYVCFGDIWAAIQSNDDMSINEHFTIALWADANASSGSLAIVKQFDF